MYYGKITAVNGSTYTYEESTQEALTQAVQAFTEMSTYAKNEMDGDTMLPSPEVQAKIEQSIENQVRASGFAEDAAMYLAGMAVQTDGFQSLAGAKELMYQDENGNPLTSEEISLLAGKTFELNDDVKLRVELGKSEKYFTDGIRAAIKIDASFSVEPIEDAGTIEIEMSASFEEEVAIDVIAQGNIDVTWVAFIPVFDEIGFSSDVDVKNYTGVSFDIIAYSVAPEEKSVWEKLVNFSGMKIDIPDVPGADTVKGALNTANEYIQKADEIKSQIEEAKEGVEDLQKQYKEYTDKANGIWEDIETVTNGEFNTDSYSGMMESLGAMNVTDELKDLIGVDDKTEIETGMIDLMERYSEMVNKDTDWIELVNAPFVDVEVTVLHILAVHYTIALKIQADVSIALGSNMEYVSGKRYSFWFELISGTSGTSTMDLLDEKFAFQFYVMGRLGLKVGLYLEFAVGLFSTSLASIGATAEVGPYVKFWGYFIYEYIKNRPMGETDWITKEQAMGAVLLEFGIYMDLTFKAQALADTFVWQPTLLSEEWKLLEFGDERDVHSFGYEMKDDDILILVDANSVKHADGSRTYTMELPEEYREMQYMNLRTGEQLKDIYTLSDYTYGVSNPEFSFDKNNGDITVTVPDGVQYMSTDLTMTWIPKGISFNLNPITVTIPVVWTTLGLSELQERHTVSVLAGSVEDGYDIVWSERVIKNKEFDLPADEIILDVLEYSSYETEYGNLKYEADYTGFGEQKTTDLTVYRPTDYEFDIALREYSVAVDEVQSDDGSTRTETFTGHYGTLLKNADGDTVTEALADTGTNIEATHEYTIYDAIQSDKMNPAVDQDAEITERLSDKVQLDEPINTSLALDILEGVSYDAIYANNAVEVVFEFTGLAPSTIRETMTLKKGDVPDFDYNAYVNDQYEGTAIPKSISPAIAPVYDSTTYEVTVERMDEGEEVPGFYATTYMSLGEKYAERNHYVDTTITRPKNPERIGYTFGGWYTDTSFNEEFKFSLETMPEHNITVYAKWIANEYEISFDVNSGSQLSEDEMTKTVVYNQTYGDMPIPVRSNYIFQGWFTEKSGGTEIGSTTQVQITKDITLYAQWKEKATLDDVLQITYDKNQTITYNGNHHAFEYQWSGLPEGITEDMLKPMYMRAQVNQKVTTEGKSWYDADYDDTAIEAGTYMVRFSIPETDYYQAYDKIIDTAIVINKKSRFLSAQNLNLEAQVLFNNITVEQLPKNTYHNEGVVQYGATVQKKTNTAWQSARSFIELSENTKYVMSVYVQESENYFRTNTVDVDTVQTGTRQKFKDITYSLGIKTGNNGSDGSRRKDGRINTITNSKNSQKLTIGYVAKNDYKTHEFGGLSSIDPWMVGSVGLHMPDKALNQKWKINYLDLKVSYAGKKISKKVPFDVTLREDGNWVDKNVDMKRVITAIEYNFTDQVITLKPTDTVYTSPAFSGNVTDQYGTYNAYGHQDKPKFIVKANDARYDEFVSSTMKDYNLDLAGIYETMKLYGQKEIVLRVELKFPSRSTASTPDVVQQITIKMPE